ncbi:MAG: PEP-CTERM/exosortase system-associated acyltransferase [Sulfuritalea sp.]|nr:PEP-CTERM/exosortase system-associated acyltransferase [Sulfuritalea sp.]
MLVEMLTQGGRRDLIAPHFSFRRLASREAEAETFREIARLRYEVYCAECGFLAAKDYPWGLETDDYDSRSVHVSAQARDGALVGTVRLVLGAEREVFPFEEHCVVFSDFVLPPREQSAEVSRLIVKKDFRRRPGDNLQAVTRKFQIDGKAEDVAPSTKPIIAARKERRNSSPQIMLGMYREMYRYSRQHGIRYWYAAMEKGLARLLHRMGFHFVPVGPETDYYGPVTTYIADLRQAEKSLESANRFLFAWFQDQPISDWLLVTTIVKYKLGHLGKP